MRIEISTNEKDGINVLYESAVGLTLFEAASSRNKVGAKRKPNRKSAFTTSASSSCTAHLLWCLLLVGLLLNRQVELELSRQLVFGVQAVAEVHTSNTAIGVYLQKQTEQVPYSTAQNSLQLYIAVYDAKQDKESYLDAQRLDVVSAVGTSREVAQVELNLIPTLIETHRHCADERPTQHKASVSSSPFQKHTKL